MPSQRSRFTRRDLAEMAACVPSCPLRVIVHIDLDAYYAQCEMLRLGVSEETPLAVQQWRNLIAVNYPARKHGIGRMVSVAEARRLCPELVVQHVATWKAGETQWAYHADAERQMSSHKVSLEPYRIRSRDILRAIRESLPGRCRIEKAGIDEVFLDLSAYVHDVLRGCGLGEGLGDELGDADDLPLPSCRLDWTGSGVIDATGERQEAPGEDDARDDAPADWDDVALMEGARLVRAVRQAVYDRLRFRCSAGIAGNKLLSKLGSSQHKPDRQTVVRARAVAAFLGRLPSVTRMRGLGGKLGARVTAVFGTESVADLRSVAQADFERRLAADMDAATARHVYWMLRGVDWSEVTARTEVQSLISAKSFQPPLATLEQLQRWLRVFAAEMRCRLLDEGLSLEILETASVGSVAQDGAGSVDSASVDRKAASATGSSVEQKGGQAMRAMQTSQAVQLQALETPTQGQTQRHTQAAGEAATVGGSRPNRPQVHVEAHAVVHATVHAAVHAPAHARLPQTIRLHFGVAGHWRSRQMRIPRDGAALDEDKLLRLAHVLLEQAKRLESQALLPCPHLALSLDGFGPTPATGSRSIVAFLGEASNEAHDEAHEAEAPAKRRRTTANTPCSRCNRTFATATQLQEHQDWHVARDLQARERITLTPAARSRRREAMPISSFFQKSSQGRGGRGRDPGGPDKDRGPGNPNPDKDGDPLPDPLTCSRCAAAFADSGSLQVHEDWHFASDLANG